MTVRLNNSEKVGQFEIFRFIGIISIIIYHTAKKIPMFEKILLIMRAEYI